MRRMRIMMMATQRSGKAWLSGSRLVANVMDTSGDWTLEVRTQAILVVLGLTLRSTAKHSYSADMFLSRVINDE